MLSQRPRSQNIPDGSPFLHARHRCCAVCASKHHCTSFPILSARKDAPETIKYRGIIAYGEYLVNGPDARDHQREPTIYRHRYFVFGHQVLKRASYRSWKELAYSDEE